MKSRYDPLASGYAVDTTTSAAFIGVLNSTPAGNNWLITLHGAAGNPLFTVPFTGQTQAQLASQFASLINGGGPAGLTALAEGNQLAIVSRDVSRWTASFA